MVSLDLRREHKMGVKTKRPLTKGQGGRSNRLTVSNRRNKKNRKAWQLEGGRRCLVSKCPEGFTNDRDKSRPLTKTLGSKD